MSTPARKPIPKISKKRLAELGGKKPWSTIASPRKAVRKSKRKPSETLRIYGPIARRKWMKTLPCSACGVVGYSEGAHVLGNGGTGRKADADTQAPLCGRHPTRFPMLIYPGCHNFYDEHYEEFRRMFPNYNAEKAAAQTQIAWLSIKGEGK